MSTCSSGILSHYSADSNGAATLLRDTKLSYRNKTQAWWLTNPSRRGSNRVFDGVDGYDNFGGDDDEETWDLTPSLIELAEIGRSNVALKQPNIRIKEWLSSDSSHGFIRIYSHTSSSVIVPCAISTTVAKIAVILGVTQNSLFVQCHGDVTRRLYSDENPLSIQNEYLMNIGYSDGDRIQEEGTSEDLQYLIKFSTDKPNVDGTYTSDKLKSIIETRKGRFSSWQKKLCTICGTRMTVYKSTSPNQDTATVMELVKGRVEEVNMKGRENVLKVNTCIGGERTYYLSFSQASDYLKWLRKLKKATIKLPTKADLSNCNLEVLPHTIFNNEHLLLLNLRKNLLTEKSMAGFGSERILVLPQIGYIDDLTKFTRLRSLNLADNRLTYFPLSLCEITTLVELNLSSNKIERIPEETNRLRNLQALHLHNNLLRHLPDNLTTMNRLFILVLAFNKFNQLPPAVAALTDVRISDVEKVIMAGNQISKLSNEAILKKLRFAKVMDLRLNRLQLHASETFKFHVLEQLTHLDIRDNYVTDLNLRCVKGLQSLHCERNRMSNLQLCGNCLKEVFASNNSLEQFAISPKPELLHTLDISQNQLRTLPDYLSECFFLERFYINNNNLSSLPLRIFSSAKKLRILRADHNRLTELPEVEEGRSFLIEEAYLQANQIKQLPRYFLQSANKLKILNLSSNRLNFLPNLNEMYDLNKVQELYLTGNLLNDRACFTLCGFHRLKILHLAYNDLTRLPEEIGNLQFLQEINVSGNQLRFLPSCLGNLQKLVVLRAHSNALNSLPDLKKASNLRVLDVGHNRLLNVNVTSLMASQISLLDMSLNAQLKVDPKAFKNLRHKKRVCLVDLTGQNRGLPGLTGRTFPDPLDDPADHDPTLPWKVGFSISPGWRNKLCIKMVKELSFGGRDSAVVGLIDGGRNDQVAKKLLTLLPEILEEEVNRSGNRSKFLKYTFIRAHAKLASIGQKIGASVALIYVQRTYSGTVNQYNLQLANVGDVEAVLCRRGDAQLITKLHSISDSEERQRIYETSAIVTEEGKINGTTKCTRQLGVSYLYPHVIPDPHVARIALRPDDEFVIIGNKSLWRFVSYDEAVERIYDVGSPVAAAKQLQDLAQSYGCRENIGVMVIRLNTDRGPSLARLKRNQSMSIDDLDAAKELEERKHKQTKSSPAYMELPFPPARISTGPASLPEQKKHSKGLKGLRVRSASTSKEIDDESSSIVNSEYSTDNGSPQKVVTLKPLPKQRFRKKNVLEGWEDVLKKRLQNDVKSKELEHSAMQLNTSSLVSSGGVWVNGESNWFKQSTSSSRTITPPAWTSAAPGAGANPAYSAFEGDEDDDPKPVSIRVSRQHSREDDAQPASVRVTRPALQMFDIAQL